MSADSSAQRDSNTSGYSATSIKVIEPQVLLINQNGFTGPEDNVDALPASHTISSQRPRTSVSPSQTSDFDLPPGGVDAATRKLQDELQALRAMKRARVAQGSPAVPPNGNATVNPGRRRSSICYNKPPAISISGGAADGADLPLDSEMRDSNMYYSANSVVHASPSPCPPFSASISGLDGAAPEARASVGGGTIADANGAQAHLSGVASGSPVHVSSSEIEPCEGTTPTSAPVTPLHQLESQQQHSQPPEVKAPSSPPANERKAGGEGDLSYEQWCKQSERPSQGEDFEQLQPTEQTPMVNGEKGVRLSPSPRPSDMSGHELSGLQVGDDSCGPGLALKDTASANPRASLPESIRLAPDHRASPSLPFPPPGPVQQGFKLSEGVGSQENLRSPTESRDLLGPLPHPQTRSAQQVSVAPQRKWARIASTGRVRFAQASDDDKSSSDSDENVGMAQRQPTMLFSRASRSTPPRNSGQPPSKNIGNVAPGLQRSCSTNSKGLKDLFRKDSTLSSEGSSEQFGVPNAKAKDYRHGGTSGSGSHRKSLSDIMRTITHMGRKSAPSETVTGLSSQGGERSSNNSASSTNQGSSDESDDEASSAVLGTQSGMDERAKEGGHKKKNKKKGKGGASMLVHHSRKSIDAMRSVLHLGGHSSSSSGNLGMQKHNFLSRSMANLGALMHNQNDSLRKELENVQDGPNFSSSRPKPRASIDTFRSKALSGGKKMGQLLSRKSVDLDNIEGKQKATYDELDDVGVVPPVPEPEHEAGLLLPPAPPLRYSIDVSGAHTAGGRVFTQTRSSRESWSSRPTHGPSSEQQQQLGFHTLEAIPAASRGPNKNSLSSPQMSSHVLPHLEVNPLSVPTAAEELRNKVDASKARQSSLLMPVPREPSPPAAPTAAAPKQHMSTDGRASTHSENNSSRLAFVSGLYAKQPSPAVAPRQQGSTDWRASTSNSSPLAFASGLYAKLPDPSASRAAARAAANNQNNSSSTSGVISGLGGHGDEGGLSAAANREAHKQGAHAQGVGSQPEREDGKPKQQQQQQEQGVGLKSSGHLRVLTCSMHLQPAKDAGQTGWTGGGEVSKQPVRRSSLSEPQAAKAHTFLIDEDSVLERRPSHLAARAAAKLGCRRSSGSRSAASSSRADSDMLPLPGWSSQPHSHATSRRASALGSPASANPPGTRFTGLGRRSMPEMYSSTRGSFFHAPQRLASCSTTLFEQNRSQAVYDGEQQQPQQQQQGKQQQEEQHKEEQEGETVQDSEPIEPPLSSPSGSPSMAANARRNPLFRNVDSLRSRDSQPSSPTTQPSQAVNPFGAPPREGPSIWELQSSSPNSRPSSTNNTRHSGSPSVSRIPKGPSPAQPLPSQPHTPAPVAAPSKLPAPPHLAERKQQQQDAPPHAMQHLQQQQQQQRQQQIATPLEARQQQQQEHLPSQVSKQQQQQQKQQQQQLAERGHSSAPIPPVSSHTILTHNSEPDSVDAAGRSPPHLKRSLTQAQTQATVQLLLAKLGALPQELRAQIAKELSQGKDSASLSQNLQPTTLERPAASGPPPMEINAGDPGEQPTDMSNGTELAAASQKGRGTPKTPEPAAATANTPAAADTADTAAAPAEPAGEAGAHPPSSVAHGAAAAAAAKHGSDKVTPAGSSTADSAAGSVQIGAEGTSLAPAPAAPAPVETAAATPAAAPAPAPEHAAQASAAGDASAQETRTETVEDVGGRAAEQDQLSTSHQHPKHSPDSMALQHTLAERSAASELAEAAQEVLAEGVGTTDTRDRGDAGGMLAQEGSPEHQHKPQQSAALSATSSPAPASLPLQAHPLPAQCPLSSLAPTPLSSHSHPSPAQGPVSSPAPAPLSPQAHLLPSQGPVWEWAVLPHAPAVPITTPDGHQLLLPALMLVYRGSPSHSQSPPPLDIPNQSSAPLLPGPLHHQAAHHTPGPVPLPGAHLPIPALQYGAMAPFAMAPYIATSLSPSSSSPTPPPDPSHFPSPSPLSRSFTPPTPQSAATPPASSHSHLHYPTLSNQYSNLHQHLHHSLDSITQHHSLRDPAPHTHPSPLTHAAHSPASTPKALCHSHPTLIEETLAMEDDGSEPGPAQTRLPTHGKISRQAQQNHRDQGVEAVGAPTHLCPSPMGRTPSPSNPGAPHTTSLGHTAAAHCTSAPSVWPSPSPPPQSHGPHQQQQQPEAHYPWNSAHSLQALAKASHRPRHLPQNTTGPTTSAMALHDQTLSCQGSCAHLLVSNTPYPQPKARASSLSSVYAGGVSAGAGAMTPRTHARAVSRALMGSHPVNMDLSDLDEEEGND